MKKYSLLALLLCLSLLLSGCYATPRPQASSTSAQSTEAMPPTAASESETTQKPPAVKGVYYADNLRGESTAFSTSVFPLEDGAYTGNLYYYDVAQQTSVFPCSLPGCMHSDKNCPARIENMKQVLAHDGSIYVFCCDSFEISLVRYVPQSNEQTKLFSLRVQNQENRTYVGGSFYSSEKIFFNATEMTEDATIDSLYYYDLVTDTLVTFIPGDALTGAQYEFAYGDRAIVSWSQYTEAPLELEEYLQEHPDANEDAYFDYTDEFAKTHILSELRCYDLNTLEYTDFYSVLQNGTDKRANINLSSDGCGYGEYVLYKLGDDICRYSMRTDTFEVLLHEPDAINAFLIDEYLYFIVKTDGNVGFRLYDPDTGELWELENNGEKYTVFYNGFRQTKTAIFGMYDGKKAMISKADFFAEAYENVVFY